MITYLSLGALFLACRWIVLLGTPAGRWALDDQWYGATLVTPKWFVIVQIITVCLIIIALWPFCILWAAWEHAVDN